LDRIYAPREIQRAQPEDKDLRLVRVWRVRLKTGHTVKVATIEQGARRPSMCDGCYAPCCRGALLPILTSEEFLSRRFKFTYIPLPKWLRDKGCNADFLATLAVGESGCPYFDPKTNLCTIWPNCPRSCLAYDCRLDERPEIRRFARRRERELRERGWAE